MLFVETRFVFAEDADRTRFEAAVSASKIVNGMATVAVFTVVTLSLMAVMVGAAFEVSVVMARLHPPAMVPEPVPARSSNTYSNHAPLGEVPVKGEKFVPMGALVGAGDGKVPWPKSAAL